MAVVYLHKRKDNNEIFYVGIGKTKYRANQKINRNKHWYSVVNKYGYIVEIIYKDISYEDALEIEVQLIKKYGRKDLGLGNLVNKTDGGEGNKNRILSEKDKNRLRTINIGKTLSESHKKSIGDSLRGKKLSSQTRKKMSISHSGENSQNNKLSNDDVLEIRRLYSQTNITQKEIGYLYSIRQDTVSKIINRKRWKHI